MYSFHYHRQYIYRIWLTRRGSYKKQELIILRENLGFWCSPCRSSLLIYILCCVFYLLIYVLFCFLFVFVLCHTCPNVISVSLDCPFLITPSVFSNSYSDPFGIFKRFLNAQLQSCKYKLTNAPPLVLQLSSERKPVV